MKFRDVAVFDKGLVIDIKSVKIPVLFLEFDDIICALLVFVYNLLWSNWFLFKWLWGVFHVLRFWSLCLKIWSRDKALRIYWLRKRRSISGLQLILFIFLLTLSWCCGFLRNILISFLLIFLLWTQARCCFHRFILILLILSAYLWGILVLVFQFYIFLYSNFYIFTFSWSFFTVFFRLNLNLLSNLWLYFWGVFFHRNYWIWIYFRGFFFNICFPNKFWDLLIGLILY